MLYTLYTCKSLKIVIFSRNENSRRETIRHHNCEYCTVAYALTDSQKSIYSVRMGTHTYIYVHRYGTERCQRVQTLDEKKIK